MSAEKKIIDGSVSGALDDEDVRNYLKSHPDFFERHPDMLDILHITHSSGHAVSLVEKQVSVLRERNMEMRRRLNSLTDNARENDRLYEATRGLVLKLLDARSKDELGHAFHSAMRDEFGVEQAGMILFGDSRDTTANCRVETTDTARIEIGSLLKNRKATCGVLRKEELSYLFPGTSGLNSAAVVPLYDGGELGVIAVGSSDAGHYNANMGTLFLNQIADVMVRLLPRLGMGEP